MRKRFLHDKYGANENFWDKNWQKNIYSTELPIAVNYKLTRKILQYLPKDAYILEGGCGDCHYLRYFHSLGFKTVGVDFAKKTVEQSNKRWPELDIRQGNIQNLEFIDKQFDAYYSGGVIEHFETEIDIQIKEANRVLKNNGLFFVTVPYLNMARRIQAKLALEVYTRDLDGRESFHREMVDDFYHEKPPANFHFHEYVLSANEMRKHLAAENFSVIEEMAFSSRWGLLDMAWFQRCLGSTKTDRNILNKLFGANLKIIDALERGDNSISQYISTMTGEIFGNLKLYVCRKNSI